MARDRLTRPRRGQGRWIAGVCAGVADFFGVDVTLVRLAFFLLGWFGAGELLYIALWIIAPER